LERKLYFFVAISLTILITIGSLISVEKVVEIPPVKFLDKLLHVSAYFLLTISWLFAFYKSLKLQGKRYLVGVFIFIFGIIIEIMQRVLTTFRQAELLDLFANLGGIVIACIFFSLIFNENRMK